MTDQPNGQSAESLDAGTVLRAADALDAQQTFTRAQVAYLMRIAYDSGRTARYREDLAELHATWDDKQWRRKTYEQRVADRMRDMAEAARRFNARLGRPLGYRYDGGPVEWETGRPLRNTASTRRAA